MLLENSFLTVLKVLNESIPNSAQCHQRIHSKQKLSEQHYQIKMAKWLGHWIPDPRVPSPKLLCGSTASTQPASTRQHQIKLAPHNNSAVLRHLNCSTSTHFFVVSLQMLHFTLPWNFKLLPFCLWWWQILTSSFYIFHYIKNYSIENSPHHVF